MMRRKTTIPPDDKKVDLGTIEKKIETYADSTLGRASRNQAGLRGSGRHADHEKVLRQNRAMKEGIHEALKILSATIR